MADEKQPVIPVKPDYHLVVVHPFREYTKGDRIDDADVITDVLGSHLHHNVRKVFAKDD